MTEAVDLSRAALDFVGRRVIHDGQSALVVDVRASGSTISLPLSDGGGMWNGVQFLMRYPDGRQRWTVTFPDTGDDFDGR